MKAAAILISILLVVVLLTGAVTTLSSGFTNLEVSTWMDRFAASDEPVITEDPLLNIEEEILQGDALDIIILGSDWVRQNTIYLDFYYNDFENFDLFEIGSRYLFTYNLEQNIGTFEILIIEDEYFGSYWSGVSDTYVEGVDYKGVWVDFSSYGYDVLHFVLHGQNSLSYGDYIRFSFDYQGSESFDFPYENFSIVSIEKIV